MRSESLSSIADVFGTMMSEAYAPGEYSATTLGLNNDILQNFYNAFAEALSNIGTAITEIQARHENQNEAKDTPHIHK
jgi:hypothetical protein